MASTYIYRTLGTPTNSKKYTYSLWIKKANPDTVQLLLSAGTSSSDGDFLVFRAGDYLEWQMYHSGDVGILKTKRLFRDPAAWMHIVIAYDSTDGTAGDRMKMYINGVRETEWLSTPVDPTLNLVSRINSAVQHNIGHDTYGLVSGDYFDGEMSHIQFVDGLALAPTEFGSVDATSGIWKIKTGCYATPGNNGFCLKMEDRTNLDLDSSSNAHTFTTSGTLTPTYDNPSDNFATMNPIANDSQTFSNGSKTITWTTNNKLNLSTLGMASGKWYAECKATDINSGVSGTLIGVGTADNVMNTYLSATNSGWGYRCQTGDIQNGAGNEAYGDTYTDGDIIGVAIDVDNGYVYMSKNGVWQDSGDPTSGASGTGAANNQPSYGAVLSGTQFFGCSSYDTDVLSWNFGDGYYATTSTGTTEADDAGIGQFKYDVPTGFYALCTKNMKEYG